MGPKPPGLGMGGNPTCPDAAADDRKLLWCGLAPSGAWGVGGPPGTAKNRKLAKAFQFI